MSDQTVVVDYFFTFFDLSQNTKLTNLDENLSVKLVGEKGETNVLKLNKDEELINKFENISINLYTHENLSYYKLTGQDIGKIKSLCIYLNEDNNSNKKTYLDELRVEIPQRNELFIFPIGAYLDPSTSLTLEPNLKPGQTKAHYAITTHTDTKNILKQKPKIFIEIIGDQGTTSFIPLQHSELNKYPFLSGKKDVFDIIANDIGPSIKKIVLKNDCEYLSDGSGDLHFDGLEIRTLSNGHVFNFIAISKTLKGKDVIELTPIKNIEVEYQVLLRTGGDIGSKHLPDVYFILYGSKSSTKKIYLNNYELKRDATAESLKERHFEFKSEDIGKIQKINLSINESDVPENFLFIDFIEIKIPSKSEAYKFPVDRAIGEYIEDGKTELDLEVWKHPDRLNLIEYEIITETAPDKSHINDDESRSCYIRIQGTHGRTAKIKLNDINYENTQSLDTYELRAQDCGKITKLEIFYKPESLKSKWQLESIEIKVKSRNEAYRFPINCCLNNEVSYLELEPWRKPTAAHH